MLVTLIKTEDLDDILDMYSSLGREDGHIPAEEELMDYYKFIRNNIANRDFLFLKSTEGEKITGYSTGAVVKMPYGVKEIGLGMQWYVRPEYRGSKAAYALFKVQEAWMMGLGVGEIIIQAAPDKERLYNRRGYETSQYIYRKKV